MRADGSPPVCAKNKSKSGGYAMRADGSPPLTKHDENHNHKKQNKTANPTMPEPQTGTTYG